MRTRISTDSARKVLQANADSPAAVLAREIANLLDNVPVKCCVACSRHHADRAARKRGDSFREFLLKAGELLARLAPLEKAAGEYAAAVLNEDEDGGTNYRMACEESLFRAALAAARKQEMTNG